MNLLFTFLLDFRCDAEPEALATYILALLKHEASEPDLRDELVKQLDEFFENGALVILFAIVYIRFLIIFERCNRIC